MIVHLNGQLVPAGEAKVSVFDRGFIFGDGLYEALRTVPRTDGRGGARAVGLTRHIERMRCGLDEAGIRWDPRQLGRLSEELLTANGLVDAFVYWQVTRGTPPTGAPVRQRIPGAALTPTVFGYCTPQPPIELCRRAAPRTAITREDVRWKLGHVKSTSLLGNVMCALAADAAACDEAILVRDGLVTEGVATNVIAVLRGGGGRGGGGEVVTPALSSAPMLSGVTRAILMDAAPEIVERPVGVDELRDASEIMLIGTTTLVTPIVRLNGHPVGTGQAGPVSERLLGLLLSVIASGEDDARAKPDVRVASKG
ncbi:MAG: aminotransferase class IV [Phycisphaerae bacterium]|nr:aminotransferase class IV [Phycisphaerae bacterium]